MNFQEMHIPVAPTWVAEILSPTTALNDVGRKFAKYEQLSKLLAFR
jgi:Uma2 family endonuclease